MTGAASEQGTSLRVCESEGCETRLSRFNSRPVCASCEARIEIGGASIPLPRQPAYAARPPAPTRPTTEGAVPLPGVVKGRERTYAEMTAKPARHTPVPSNGCRVEGCTKPIVTAGGSWPYLCEAHRTEKRKRQAAEEATSLETPQSPTASAAEASSKADSKVATRHAGHERQFDWDDAAQRYRDGASHDTLARHFNVSKRSIAKAVRHVLGDDAAYAIGSTRQGGAKGGRKPGPRHRKFDWDEAARLYVDEQLTQTELAERFGVNQRTISEAIRQVLGAERAREISNARRGRNPRVAPLTPASDTPATPPAPTPVAPPAEDPTPTPPELDLPLGSRVAMVERLADIGRRIDACDARRARLVEEWSELIRRLTHYDGLRS